MFLSEGLALAAAFCIALSGMLISELKGRVDVIRLARWQMLAAFAMTGGAMLALWSWNTVGPREAGLLALSGLFGIIIASTTYFAAIYIAGPRMTALLFTLASPFSLLLGYVFLGETIAGRQAAGIGLVLAGILLAIGMRRRGTVPAVPVLATTETSITELPSASTTRATLSNAAWFGIALGVITALGQALGSLVARPAMEAGVEPAAAMAVRSGVAALFFLALALVPHPLLRKPYVFKGSDLGIAVTAAFFGTGLGMSLLMAALATGNVGIVTTLSSMTPIMILPMVWLRSGVPPVKEAWFGAALAVAGTALISL
jgi:drug/metabolite transporter (DMT)-like permease